MLCTPLKNKNEKLAPVVREISWTKNIVIMEKCKDDLEREFYIKMTKKFGWTKNVLIHQVESRAYERFLLNQTNFDLKVGEFKPEYAGKMQFYLSVLNDKVRLEEENPSIGIILCKEKNRIIVEYAL